jgi:hypothetical protein
MAKRDKKEIRILSQFQGDGVAPTILDDVKKLNLPDPFANQIAATVHENRMLWEVWIESAADYGELKAKLTNRGYRNLPFKGVPMHQVRSLGFVPGPNQVITPSLQLKPKTAMIQRRGR